jgi:PPE-repeat protein
VDFGALPPEVNSGRMYTGAGSGPLVVAASAWDGLATALGSAASAYQAAILGLTGGQWLGAASVSMAAAAFPYAAWMNTTAVQAELSANQARSAAAASVQSTVSQLLNAVPNALQGLASGSSSFDPVTWLLGVLQSPVGTALNSFSTAVSIPLNDVGSGGSFLAVDAIYMVAPLITAAFPGLAPVAGELVPGAAPMAAAPAAAGLASLGGADVSAGLGRAASVGGVSVPQAWGSAAPEIRLAARGLPTVGVDALPQAEATGPGGWFGGIPPIGSVVNAPRIGEGSSDPRFRHKVIPQLATGGSLLASPPDSQTMPTRRGSDGELSERESHELNELRQEMAELAMERDAVARLIKEAIRP